MPNKFTQKTKKTGPLLKILEKRELGFKRKIGYSLDINRKLIHSLNAYKENKSDGRGGIFNLEFSLDGSILAAACERRSIVLHDALNQSVIRAMPDAHASCVNCIRFLDHFAFASGSDDNTIKLWDMRFLKSPSRELRGHGNWVKNIEYSHKENRLVTSAFDGSIFSWDLNNYTENNLVYDKVYTMDGLMRMKLTPDASKMIICTTNGYLLTIHDLKLESLMGDLQAFRPNLYRLMQTSEQNLPIVSSLNYLFSPYRKVNRVELISDFPNDAEVISSLQIHPMGWCALSRNISTDEQSEWTSVHDIQERELDEYLNEQTVPNARVEQHGNQYNPGVTTDIWMGIVTNQNFRMLRALTNQRTGGIQTTRPQIRLFNSGFLDLRENSHLSAVVDNNDPLSSPVQDDRSPEDEESDDNKIVKNLPRLMHFFEEPNVGKGFIKEQCFSADGRIVCSPYFRGIRLFSFDSYCNELTYCVPNRPQSLHHLATFKEYHPNYAVCCKFNPQQSTIVSGCLSGHIVWYQPVL